MLYLLHFIDNGHLTVKIRIDSTENASRTLRASTVLFGRFRVRFGGSRTLPCRAVRYHGEFRNAGGKSLFYRDRRLGATFRGRASTTTREPGKIGVIYHSKREEPEKDAASRAGDPDCVRAAGIFIDVPQLWVTFNT